MPAASESHRITRFSVRRTARCVVRGPEQDSAVRELWIVLHGYAQLATDFIRSFGAIDDGTRLIVAPEALSRFYDARSAMERHAEASIGASWMTREERGSEIDDYIGWLQQAYEAFAAPLTDVPVTVLGFSQGATAASRWVASGGVPAKHLVCWGASIAPELDLGETSPLRRSRCSLVIGERDQYVAAELVTAERARLDAAHFPHRFLSFLGGHRLDDATLRGIAVGQ